MTVKQLSQHANTFPCHSAVSQGILPLGNKKGGATPGEVVDKVIGAISQGTQKAVATLNLGKVADVAKEGAAKAKAEVEKVVKDVGGTLKKLLGN